MLQSSRPDPRYPAVGRLQGSLHGLHPGLAMVFLMMAFVIKFTIASVERRHAVHQQSADSSMPWHVFAARSVLSEARHQRMARDRLIAERKRRREEAAAAAEEQRRRLQIADGRADGDHAEGLHEHQEQAEQEEQAEQQQRVQKPLLRAKTPWEIYFKEWLAGQRGRGIFWNPTDRLACRKACDEAFAALPADRMASLQAEANSTIPISRADRAVVKARAKANKVAVAKVAPAAALPVAAVPHAPDLLQHPAHGAGDALADAMANDTPGRAQQGPPFSSGLACQSLEQPLAVQAAGPLQPAQQEYPVSEQTLKNRIGRRDFNTTADCQTWKQESTTIATGAASSVPEHVNYPLPCGALCRNKHTERVLKFRDAIVERMKQLVLSKSPSNRAPRAAQAELVVAVEGHVEPVLEDRQPDFIKFYAIVGATGRQAHHPMTIDFCELAVQDGFGQLTAIRLTRN